MCGLVGALVADSKWNLNNSEINIFNNLLYCSALRGADSTGVMAWDGKHVKMIKAAGHPADFIYSELYRNFLNGIKDLKMIFGHTRLATVGKVTSKNAHPFRVDNKIMLMHNGGVQSVAGETVKEFEVDSLALATALSKQSADTVFETFEGAAACIWFDMEFLTVNFYRNYQRPLSMTTSTITNYLASEADMLKWILGRGHNGHLQIKEVPSQELGTIDLKEIHPLPDFKKITRKYNYQANQGWSSGRTWDGYTDYETEEYPGYKVINRRNKHSSITPKQPPHEPRRSLPAPTTINVEASVKNVSPFHLLKEFGPFKVGEEIIVVVHTKEEYRTQSGMRFKVLCAPLFVGDQKEFDVAEYNCAKAQFFTPELAVAQKYLDEEFALGKITSIRYNSKWEDLSDRLTIYLSELREISPEVVAKINFTPEGHLSHG
jgi:hypothetical protein